MCRIAYLKGVDFGLAEKLAELQSYGANHKASFWRHEDLTFIHSRFDVTSAAFSDEEFPVCDDRYILHYNGEVFGFDDQRYIDTSEPSDVHYCLSIIRRHGIVRFLEQADLQGTFHIHDRQSGETWLFVDQINSGGGFYAAWDGKVIAAQEVALVHQLLSMMKVSEDVAICTIPNGCALLVDRFGSLQITELRPHARLVYSSTTSSLEGLQSLVVSLQHTLEESVVRRIPLHGPVVVLASGGVDSSIILVIVKNHLARIGMLDRLKVVTFGKYEVSHDQVNDLWSCSNLMDALGLSHEQHLMVVQENSIIREKLLGGKVFCDHPRLITPNPILGSQIRHTVRMSLVLAEVVHRIPEAKVVLTGDVADELFAGYPSMRHAACSTADLVKRIRDKLSDLSLNDASRYTLASLHGCRAAIRYMRDTEEDASGNIDHPIEVRTPFSSHHLLNILGQASPEYLIGSIEESPVSKFPLRIVALRLGIPIAIATRTKIPFNHGGTGLSNDSSDPLELDAAHCWKSLSDHDLRRTLREEGKTLRQLGLLGDDVDAESNLEKRPEQVIAYLAAKGAGLDRLIKGNTFRHQMPDAVYATDLKDGLYTPRDLIGFDPVRNSFYFAGPTRLGGFDVQDS